ncbi:glutamate-1-semialdehyde 2,1-aminomutase [Petrachloros mirabilis]
MSAQERSGPSGGSEDRAVSDRTDRNEMPQAKSVPLNVEGSLALQSRALSLIPGGCHTYAKGDDQFPEEAPVYIARGQGCRVWDVDGNEFIEYGMGLRSVTLGHAFPDVVQAVERQLQKGVNFNRPSSIEVEAAERLASVIKSAERVKFAKDGSTVTTAAVRLSRAHTGRTVVGICSNHPFFSYNDWFICTTAMSAGIPEPYRSLTGTFDYNDIGSARRLFDRFPGQVACLILEPARLQDPVDGFLHELKALCETHGALLIFDEMITGFRWDLGGGQKYYGVIPDLSTFGKAMSNGFSVSALVGRRDIMDLGGDAGDRERVFTLSTTHGAETHALAAAIATIDVYEREAVVDRLYEQGRKLAVGLERIAGELGLQHHFEVLGKDCCLLYATRDQQQQPSQEFRTLLLQELMRRGILAPSLVVSFSHSDADIEQTIDAFGESLVVYRKALDEGVEKYLSGRPVKPVFRKYW